MSVDFHFDWVEAPPSKDERARVTMAALSIKAGDATVTSVVDRSSRSYRDHVVVPLVSVAEWLAVHWWHLFHEVENMGEQKPDFEARHNLAFAGDGFVLPCLAMAPTPERMRLRWRPLQAAPCPDRVRRRTWRGGRCRARDVGERMPQPH